MIAQRCAERDVRKECGPRNSNAGIVRSDAPLGRGDIRSALHEGCGHADRNVRQRDRRLLWLDRECGSGFADQRGYRVLGNRAQCERLGDE